MRLENFEKIIVIPKKEQRDLLVIYRRQLLGKLGVKGQAYSSKIRDALKVYDQLDEQVRLERSLPFF